MKGRQDLITLYIIQHTCCRHKSQSQGREPHECMRSGDMAKWVVWVAADL
jgi:hypothetical protein